MENRIAINRELGPQAAAEAVAKSLFTQKLRESEPAEQFCDESAHPNLPFMNPFLKTLKAIILYLEISDRYHYGSRSFVK